MTPIPFDELAAAVLREIGEGPAEVRAPRLPNCGVPGAALVFNSDGHQHLVPILAFDFYPKEHS